MALFQESEKLGRLLKMIYALAYVPPGYVVQVFEEQILKLAEDENISKQQEVLKFIEYFTNTYIGKPKRRGRHIPPFPHDTWNVFHEHMLNLPTTNNGIEQLNSQINANSPGKTTVYTIVKLIEKEFSYSEVKKREILEGTIRDSKPGRTKKLVRRRTLIKNVI